MSWWWFSISFIHSIVTNWSSTQRVVTSFPCNCLFMFIYMYHVGSRCLLYSFDYNPMIWIIHMVTHFTAQAVPTLVIECSSMLARISFWYEKNIYIYIFHFFTFWYYKVLQAHYVFSLIQLILHSLCLSSRINQTSKKPWFFFYGGLYRIQDLGTRHAPCYWNVTVSSICHCIELIHKHVYQLMHTHTYLFLFTVCKFPCQRDHILCQSRMTEFILFFPISLFASSLYKRETGISLPTIYLFICSPLIYM